MNNKVGKRIVIFINYLGISRLAFSERCSINHTTLYQIINGEILPSKSVFEKIKNRYPEVNMDWIESEIGEMLLEDFFENRFRQLKSNPKDITEMVNIMLDKFELLPSELGIKIGVNKSTIIRMRNGQTHYLKNETLNKMQVAFPFIPRKWFDL